MVRNAFGNLVVAHFDPLVVFYSLLKFGKDLIFVLKGFLLLLPQWLKGSLSSFSFGSFQALESFPSRLNLVSELAVDLLGLLMLVF